jgi:hypothetical protein
MWNLFCVYLQDELDNVLQVWNDHEIRASRRGLPSGRPRIMHDFPYLYNTSSYLSAIQYEELQQLRHLCVFRESIPCDALMFSLCCRTCQELGADPVPLHSDKALQLYFYLRATVRPLLCLTVGVWLILFGLLRVSYFNWCTRTYI